MNSTKKQNRKQKNKIKLTGGEVEGRRRVGEAAEGGAGLVMTIGEASGGGLLPKRKNELAKKKKTRGKQKLTAGTQRRRPALGRQGGDLRPFRRWSGSQLLGN